MSPLPCYGSIRHISLKVFAGQAILVKIQLSAVAKQKKKSNNNEREKKRSGRRCEISKERIG